MEKIKNLTILTFVRLCFAWVVFALCFQVFMLTTSLVNPPLEQKIGNYLTWKLDGTFKNNPDNIWYETKK